MPCTIGEFDTITGNIKITDGGLFVSGTVNGSIEQEGPGDDFGGAPDASVVVGSTGVVNDITESGPSRVLIDGTVNGSIVEQDEGSVTLFNVPDFEDGIFGIVNGNISESGAGAVWVQSELNGNAEEKDAGGVLVGAVTDSFEILEGTINGNIDESGANSVVGDFGILIFGGSVNGNATASE